jgi:mannose-6-phosphate isomerase-like protein (cupin superfamily)
MRTFDNSAAETYAVADVEVARFEQYGLEGLLPFGAMWYGVPPGSTTPTDNHPERELSIVIGGAATVEAGGARADVRRGDAFLLEPGEDHCLHSHGPEPLLVFSVYWMAAR